MSSQTGSFGGNTSNTFDFNSQAGVLTVLAAVRSSALSPSQKNELRDLVFTYTNGGGDVTVRRYLEQKLTTYGISPATVSVPPAVASTPTAVIDDAPKAPEVPEVPLEKTPPPPSTPQPFGGGRPTPAFSPVSVAAPVSKTVRAPVTPADAVSAPAPVPSPSAPSTPEPVAAPAVQSVPVVEEPSVAAIVAPLPVAEPVPVPTPVIPPVQPVPAPPRVAAASPSGYLERIREIKATVNQQVGNPVNLVDIDNAVGREYMVALLEAMKKVGGGQPGDLDAAMVRLETAYMQVQAAITAHGGATAVRTPAPLRPAAEVPAPAPVTPPPAPAPEPYSPVVAPAPASVEPAPVAAPESSRKEDTRWESAPVAQPEPAPQAPVPRAVAQAPLPSPYAVASLADDGDPLLTPQDLPDAASVETGGGGGDPLYTKEVDTGMEQLLAEWSIFKKSGLFGTGPKGREHPLFKEIGTLTIPLILAGHYEGATPEIRQSITDYMNGWRYEQGIVYKEDETFESYLRRVIRHIIDLQKKHTPA